MFNELPDKVHESHFVEFLAIVSQISISLNFRSLRRLTSAPKMKQNLKMIPYCLKSYDVLT